MKSVPAVPFFIIVANYARAKGMKFFTVEEQRNAIAHYIIDASQLN